MRVVVEEGIGGSCTVGVLFRGTVLEEPFPAAEETLGRGLIRGPEKASVKGWNTQSCTLDILFSRTALEEPFTAVEGFDLGLDVGAQGRPP